MQKIDVSEFLSGGKQRPQDPAARRMPGGSSYNAFLGFAVTDAATVLLRRLKNILVGKRSPAVEPTPDVILESDRVAPAEKSPACSAFGDLPPVPGSSEVTFRN